MKPKVCFFLATLFICVFANAQVKTNYNNKDHLNEKGVYKKAYKVVYYDIATPDTNVIWRKDKEYNKSEYKKPFRFAEPLAVNINVIENMQWQTEGSYAFGRFVLRIKHAKSLSINFVDFHLPDSTEMYIFNKDGEMITGAITERENNDKGFWGSDVYKGEELNIEIKVPANNKSKLRLRITNVAFGYKNIFVDKIYGFGASGTCNINVLCPLGNGWDGERNSVALVLNQNGSSWCSGALIMNTCGTNVPNFLTANHCLDNGSEDVSKWRFVFQRWSATCTPDQDNGGVLFNGSSNRSNSAQTDFALLLLNQTPSVNSNFNYSGWTRATNAATNGVGIHHPAGDVMKISTYTTPLIRADNPTLCNINPVGDLQWVVQWNQGVTEGGSSGSPLFDQNHRIVGQLGGGPSSCAATIPCRQDAYGRFDNSWTGGGTNATRLSNWLDPNNTGAVTTNTTSISSLINPNLTLSITGSSSLCSSTEDYTLNGAPAGSTINWTSSNPLMAPITTTGNPATLTRNVTNGDVVTITATIANGPNCFTPSSVSTTVTVGKPIISGPLIIYNGPGDENEVCRNVENTIDMTTSGNSTTTWSLLSWTGGPQPSWAGANEDLYLYFFKPNQQTALFKMDVSNACGTETYNFGFQAVDCGYRLSSQKAYKISPNPAGSFINIGPVEMLGSEAEKRLITEVVISDFNNNPISREKFGNVKTAQLSIAGLKQGTYYVKIISGSYFEMQTIIKQ